MVLSKRERYIVIGVAIAGIALVMDKVVIGPLWDNLSETSTQKEFLQKRMNEANDRLATSARLAPRWNEIIRTGMKDDSSDAVGQVVQAIHNWASESRFNIQMIKADPQPPAKDAYLGEITFTVAGSGPMNSLAQLLWRMQYATIPLRITEIQAVTTKDAVDNLSATMRLSTVYLPGGKKTTPQPVPAASSAPTSASAPAGGAR
jgi:hypothetical protein